MTLEAFISGWLCGFSFGVAVTWMIYSFDGKKKK